MQTTIVLEHAVFEPSTFLPRSEPSILDDCQLDDKTKDVLLMDIKRRMTPQAVKVRSDIEVACYGYEGIDAVKAALKEGLKFSTEELPIKVSLYIQWILPGVIFNTKSSSQCVYYL